VKKKFSALAAGLLSITMMFGACGQDTTIAATIDGMQIPAGIFINFQTQGYSDAMLEIQTAAEEAAAGTTATDPALVGPDADPAAVSSADPATPATITVTSVTKPLLEDSIDGVPVTKWINDKAIEYVREYAAVEKHFADLGLTFKNNEDASALAYFDQNWQYYEPQLKDLGISRESYEKTLVNALKREELQMYYYGKGGEFAVSDDAIKTYLRENYTRIDYIPMVLKDGEGNLLKSDGKAAQMTMAEDFVKRAEAGEDFDSLLGEYNDYYAALQKEAADALAKATEAAAASTAENGTVVTADGTDTTTDSTTTADAATDEADPNAETQTVTNETVVYKDNASPSAEVVTEAFARQTANPGATEYFIVEDPGGEMYYVVKVTDLFADANYLEDNRDYATLELSKEDFDALVSEWTTTQEVVLNDKAISRYKAKKIDDLYNTPIE
jgi:hypothetical protein